MIIFYSLLTIILLAGLSFANGANDISKTIATLAGAGVASVRQAILWGCFWMVVGGLTGIYWGLEIIKNLTENIYLVTENLPFEMAVSIAVAPIIWVFLSTFKKWPVSTTHAIVGSLIGAGLIALGAEFIAWEKVGKKIVLPLLISPFVSIFLAIFLTPSLKTLLNKIKKYTFFSFKLSEDNLHWVTSAMLSYARGLNDTPKLIAVMLPLSLAVGNTLHVVFFVLAAVSMGLGGLIAGKRITEVLGFQITKLSHKQGFIANLVSAFLVIGASKMGMPVSTTHVSASAIMGTGLAEKTKLQKDTVISMLLAWLITVPASAIIAVICFLFLQNI